MSDLSNFTQKRTIGKDLFHTVYFVRSLEEDHNGSRTSFFIRINTKGMNPYFAIESSKNDVNIAGEIAKMQWMQIPSFYPNICLDSFTINASSVQGIVSIIDDKNNIPKHKELEELFNFPPPKLLLEAFTHFKACCTKSINTSMPDLGFGWQPLFTSLIISNNTSLTRFRDYIQNK